MELSYKNILEVCNVYQPKTIATKKFIPDGKYIVYGANGEIGRYNDYNHEESEILMACRGATCGAINVSKPYSWINGNAMVIQPNGIVPIDKKYLQYFLMSIDKNKLITGTAQPQITRHNMSDFKIGLCEIEVQKCIVNRIEELFSELDKVEETLLKTKAQLVVYKQAVLKEAFLGCPMVPLGEISNSRLGKMLDKKKNTGTPHNYLRNINVRWLCFALDDLLEMPFEDKEIEKFSVKKGDLLICEGGEPGRCAVWKYDNSILFQKAIHRVRFKSQFIPDFYAYYFWYAAKTGALNEYFTGSGIKHLTGESLVKIPVPQLSYNGQIKVVEMLEKEFSLIKNISIDINKTLIQIKSLRQSILKEAFVGKLV